MLETKTKKVERKIDTLKLLSRKGCWNLCSTFRLETHQCKERIYHHLNMIEVFQSKYLEVDLCCAYASKTSPVAISLSYLLSVLPTTPSVHMTLLRVAWTLEKVDKGQQKRTSEL